MSVADIAQSRIDIYADPRVKLGKVPDTIITCKHFVEAVEKSEIVWKYSIIYPYK